jgi:hypothetical protein
VGCGANGEFGSNRYRYRYRDLADLLLISRQETVPGQAVTQALHREADRRQVAAAARLERAVRRPWPSLAYTPPGGCPPGRSRQG